MRQVLIVTKSTAYDNNNFLLRFLEKTDQSKTSPDIEHGKEPVNIFATRRTRKMYTGSAHYFRMGLIKQKVNHTLWKMNCFYDGRIFSILIKNRPLIRAKFTFFPRLLNFFHSTRLIKGK